MSSVFADFYRVDEARRVLWIIFPKHASNSLHNAIGELVTYPAKYGARLLNEKMFTVATIRHPYSRAVAALKTVLWSEDRAFEDNLRFNLNNRHVRPIHGTLDGIRVDHWLRFEHLADDWAALDAKRAVTELEYSRPYRMIRYPERLPMINVDPNAGKRPNWRNVSCDWKAFNKQFETDFSLNPEYDVR